VQGTAAGDATVEVGDQELLDRLVVGDPLLGEQDAPGGVGLDQVVDHRDVPRHGRTHLHLLGHDGPG
jgi:hypothetical protein